MNVQSYTILHYGRDYLSYALRSVYDRVAMLHVVYTPHPSHGHGTDSQPVESRDDLLRAAFAYDPQGKVRWHEVHHIWNEGPHRDMALKTCQEAGADLALVLDCDEVWPAETLERALAHIQAAERKRNWLLNFTSLWRSFDWVVRDDLWPVRVIDLHADTGTAYIPRELGPVYHFGYAVRDEVLRYKMSIHGHKNEFRPDWYETKWRAWPPIPDCHPTNERGFWNPEPFDRNLLPDLMRRHPFWGVERIE